MTAPGLLLAQAGSGTISAAPNPCTIPSGASMCTTTITWQTQNLSAAEVTVLEQPGGTENLFAGGVSGSSDAPWIQGPPRTYTFTLYDTSSGSRVRLASITVAAVFNQSSSGTITASPNPCTIPAGSSLCTTTISWQTQNATMAEVTVQDGLGGSENLFGRAPSGSYAAPWIPAPPHSAVFTLYDTSSGSRVRLASVTVTATTNPSASGTISASPNPCIFPAGASLCTTTVTWQTQNASAADVTVLEQPGGAENLFAGGVSGSSTAPWIQGPPRTYAFTLYDVSSGSRVRLASVTVTGTSGITVVVSPASVSLQTAAQQQFSATVSGTTDQRVTWRVNDLPGGSTTTGTISPQGLYTAPASVPSTPTVTVKATSVADPNQSGTAQVTIVGAPSIRFVQPTSFAQGAAGPITITVDGANFTAASVVRIDNGSGPDPRPTQLVDSTRVRGTLPASDFATQHIALIDVFQTPSGPRSNLFAVVVTAAPGAPRSVFVRAGQTSSGNDIVLTDASSSPPLNISFVGLGSTGRAFAIQVTRGTEASVVIFGDGLSQRDPQNPDTITPQAEVRLSGPADITLSSVTGVFSQAGRPGLRFNINVGSTALAGPRNIIVENANHDIAIAFGALVVR